MFTVAEIIEREREERKTPVNRLVFPLTSCFRSGKPLPPFSRSMSVKWKPQFHITLVVKAAEGGRDALVSTIAAPRT